MHLHERAAQIEQAGRLPLPSREYANVADYDDATHILIRLGLQPASGRYLYMADLDTHHAGQNAARALADFRQVEPTIAGKFAICPSTNKGYHCFFESYSPLEGGKLYDADGRHIGELITDRTLDPGDIAPGCLNKSEIERLTARWSVKGAGSSGDRWAARAKEGKRLIAGGKRQQVTKAQLRAFLHDHCGTVGAHLDSLFDERKPFNRSDATGNLMQCIMFNVHKITPSGGYSDRCAAAYDYWLAADSYGKADDKDYSQDKDGSALVAKIVNEDAKESGGHWRAPFWAKSHPTPPPAAAAPEAAPRRPAHRPAGDRERMRRKIARYLELRAFESIDNKLHYDVDDLAACFKLARRTMQSYLSELEHDCKLFTRGQDAGPGGRAWLIWGADNSSAPAESDQKSGAIWGADASAIERNSTPQNGDRSPVCKEDHQNLSTPTPPAQPAHSGESFDPMAISHRWRCPGFDDGAEPEAAAYVPGVTFTPADPAIPRLRSEPRDVGAAPRRPHRQARPVGQAAFMGRGDDVAAKYRRRKRLAPLPSPTPYRPGAGVPEERLPDTLGRPAGPQGRAASGDLPGAPAGAPPPDAPGLIARLKARQGGAL